MREIIGGFLIFNILAAPSYAQKSTQELTEENFTLAAQHASNMIAAMNAYPEQLPRTIDAGGNLVTCNSSWWTSGFFPGVLWLLYERTGDTQFKDSARLFTARIEKEKSNTGTHDLGFMLYNSFGNGLRLTNDPAYREVLLAGARSLISRYNPRVGCIMSWNANARWKFPVIIDNMMNLEFLLWAYKSGGDRTFYDIAVTHADTTIKNHFRKDNSSYHVVSYDPATGDVEKKQTSQGYADESSWARGQSWGLYGFVMMYRETGLKRYLDQAHKIAAYLINHPHFPPDKVPYWDYDAPNIPNEKRDASAAAIMASALVELGWYSPPDLAAKYLEVAVQQVQALSSAEYRARPGTNGNFLLKHSIGSIPGKSEVDVPLTYADYYFLETLKRLSDNRTRLKIFPQSQGQPQIYIRINQAGYAPAAAKSALAFSNAPLEDTFFLVPADGTQSVFEGKITRPDSQVWGSFPYHAELDFTPYQKPGRYFLRLARSGAQSAAFVIGASALAGVPDQLLEFMRQQRCGYNPFLDTVCHPFDSRTAFATVKDGSYLDARGGWHDAGDQLKYLLTSSNATAQMLLAFKLAPKIFGDRHDEWGQPNPNGIADVLDEARWGLDWMLRLHPAPDALFHQVADDRDHIGWRLPHKDTSDYGWGPGSYRVVYFATGKPQGLGRYQSESTGVANLAGRYAAAMALAYQVWKADARLQSYAESCLRAGVEVYRLGKAKEGVQQGNSYGAPYRYGESTWADDMEWGAAELYRATGDKSYREDARRYAQEIGAASWMGLETAGHYQYYPFMNLGHFALYDQVDKTFQKTLAGLYRSGLESCRSAGLRNPYRLGVPFIWCSNNLVVALATQGRLYEMMTGDTTYRIFTAVQLDWLFGRNPWGTSMFTGVPEGGIFPQDPHLVTTSLTGRSVRGGLVDGPVAETIFQSLKGVTLSRPDLFALFHSKQAVYHDDMADYSSNEPTMDGTASAILLLALFAAGPTG